MRLVETGMMTEIKEDCLVPRQADNEKYVWNYVGHSKGLTASFYPELLQEK